eukprot:gene4387-5133_t
MSKTDQPMEDVEEEEVDEVEENKDEDHDDAEAEDHDEEEAEDDEDEEDSKTTTKTGAAGEEKKEKKKAVVKKQTTQLPIARIKRIMKNDKDVKLISSDASLLITRSTELFLEYLVQEAYKKTTGDKRKILSYKDLFKDLDCMEFLADIIPPKVSI